MFKKKFSFGTLLAAFMIMALTVSTMAQRQGSMRGHQKGMKGSHSCMQMIPDLSEEQKNKIREIRNDHWQAMSEYRDDMRTLRAEYHDMASGKDRNLNKAENKIDDITGLKNSMMKERLNHMESIRNLLNDKQKEAFDRMTQRHKASMRMGKGYDGKGHQSGHKGAWHGQQGRCDGDGPRWINNDD